MEFEDLKLESADDIALADKLREGHAKVLSEIHKLIMSRTLFDL